MLSLSRHYHLLRLKSSEIWLIVWERRDEGSRNKGSVINLAVLRSYCQACKQDIEQKLNVSRFSFLVVAEKTKYGYH